MREGSVKKDVCGQGNEGTLVDKERSLLHLLGEPGSGDRCGN